MGRLCKGTLWAIATMVLVSVLFADFLPLPLGSYASQRFLLAGFLALVVVVSGALWVHRNGWFAFWHAWPVIVVAASFLLLAYPFKHTLYAWAEPGMYAAFFSGLFSPAIPWLCMAISTAV